MTDACAAAQVHDPPGGLCPFQAPTHQFRWIGRPRLRVEGGQAGEAFGEAHGELRAEAKLGLRLL